MTQPVTLTEYRQAITETLTWPALNRIVGLNILERDLRSCQWHPPWRARANQLADMASRCADREARRYGIPRETALLELLDS